MGVVEVPVVGLVAADFVDVHTGRRVAVPDSEGKARVKQHWFGC